jgi:tetratricopeptide (TPR) repeat protein
MMQMAVDSGVPNLENTAWTRTQLGNLYFNSGNLEKAEKEYQRTLYDYPGYVYALAGLGRVRVAQGFTSQGIDLLNQASQSVPIPELIITLADAYKINGQPEVAQRQYDLLRVIHQLYQANGVDMDLEIALFNADHGFELEATLAQARRTFERRPSIYAADVLAWILYKTGNYEEAQSFSDQALRLGTRDALKLFHAGMIRYRLGDHARARQYLERALAINPYFSILYLQEAQRTLDELKAASPGK